MQPRPAGEREAHHLLVAALVTLRQPARESRRRVQLLVNIADQMEQPHQIVGLHIITRRNASICVSAFGARGDSPGVPSDENGRST